MQLYFSTYAGYFRLLWESHLLLICYTARFLHRGWVQRDKLANINDVSQWLMLPLLSGPPTSVLTGDLQLQPDLQAVMVERPDHFYCR
jgi:hypothetical protein